MNRRFALSAALMLAVALTAGACGKKPVETPPPAPPPPAAPPTRPQDPPPPPPPPAQQPQPELTEDQLFERLTLDELNKQAPLAPVFFALDSTELTQEARAIIQKNVEWLKRRMSTRILVEGHADNRGTNEYNLALAERRADAVRDYLVDLGVATDRIAIVSKGEEQPFCTEDTEGCWQQNRRGQFSFTAK